MTDHSEADTKMSALAKNIVDEHQIQRLIMTFCGCMLPAYIKFDHFKQALA